MSSRAPPLFDNGWEDHADAVDPSASPRRSPRYAGGVPADAAGAARPEHRARRQSPPRPSSAGPAIRTVSMGRLNGPCALWSVSKGVGGGRTGRITALPLSSGPR